ncbi:MAG TPA: hypothetical protein VHH54_01070 [Actinomycetota bacterium]|nr:hypothetical protein [Actinomycetota bacterium]
MPTCGVGKERQIDIHNFNLFDVAARETGMYSKELADLTRKLNVLFRREGKAALLRKQKELDDKSIMLTIALHEGGLYLTYARPARKRPQRGLAPSRLQTRQAARRS